MAVFAANCGLDKLTGDSNAASTVRFAVSGDSVLSVGVSRPFAITPSEPVNFSNIQLAYDLSDTTLARVDSVRGQTAWVTGLRNGTLRVRLTARSAELPGGRVDSARVRVRFAAIRIDAIDTIAGLGPLNNANQRTVVVRGTRPDGTPVAGTPTVAATLVSRDTTRLRATTAGGTTFIARDTGLVWVVATFDGAVDSVRVPIRRRVTRIVADSLAFGALFTSRSAPVRILDAGDSAIVGTPFRFAGLDTVRLQVDSTGPGASANAPRLRARVRDTSSYQIQAGTFTSTRARTRVQQVPAGIILGAGGSQSARYGTLLATPPRVVVRDSGAQGIGGVTVTFSVPSAAHGVITGASVVTNAAGEATVGSWQLGPATGVDSLIATVAGLPPFVVTATSLAGPAARLRFVQQPLGGARNGKVQPPPQVAVVDSVGNVVSQATDSITVASVGTAGGTLSGLLSAPAVAGIAQFDSLVFSDTTLTARLVASGAGLDGDTSAIFPIGLAPTELVFATQPAGVAGGSLMAPVVVELRDALGNRAVGAADTVTLSLGTSIATLSGTTRKAAVGGRVTFDDLRVLGGGNNSYAIQATTSAGLVRFSSSFTVVIGPASQLRFRSPPANVAPGVTQPFVVIVTDSGGNQTNTTGANITLRLGTNSGSATLTDTLRTASSGQASFSSAVSAAGTGYTVVASSPGLASATTAPFNVQAAGVPARLRWVTKTQIANQAGFGLPSGIELLDAANVRSTLTRFPYTLSVLSGPASASITSTTDSVFTAGVSFAPSVRVRTAGTYRFIVSAPGVAPDTSGPIVFLPASGARLTVVTQPTATGVGSPISPVQVALTDSLGNVTSFLPNGTFVGNSLSITATGLNATGGSVALGGTVSQTTTAGVATFPDLSIAAAGTGYRLQFASGAVAVAQSDTFTVRAAGTPRQLRLSALPAVITGGGQINPSLRVSIIDSVGTTVSTRTDSIVLALRGPAGATLAGPTRVAAVNGIAEFPGLNIPRADSGLRIVATSDQAGIAADSTPVFRVVVGQATRLRFVQVPTVLIGGAVLTPPPIVAATDSGGNLVVSATDSLALAAFSGSTGWSVGGRNGAALVNGVAQFDSVTTFAAVGAEVRFQAFSLRGNSYTRRDTSSSLTAVIGPPARVRVSWGTGNRLSTFQSNFLSGNVVDAGGSTVTTASVPVTLSVIGTGGAVVAGTSTATSTEGVWQMTPVSVTAPGTYRWVVSSPGLLPDTSASFVVTGAVQRPRIVLAPAAGVRNGVLGPVRVILLDTLGQGVRLAGANVTLSLSGAGVLNGTRTRSTLATFADTTGAVTFADLATPSTGTRFLVASVGPGFGVSGAVVMDSVALPIAAFGPAAALQFTTQPGSLVAGQTMAVSPVVTVLDSVGNVVTDSVARSISLSLQQGVQPGTSTPTNGFLTGSLSVTPAPGTGTASFANLSVNNAGNGYSLVATANGVNAAQSAAFNVVQTTDAIALRFLANTVPSSTSAGAPLAGTGGALAVEIINSTGSRVTTSTAPVTISVRNARAAIVGTTTVNATAGVATFSGVAIQRADTGYVLVASSPALNAAAAPTSTTVVPSLALNLRVLDSLPTVVAGSAWPALRVAVVDGFGNVVTSATQSISLRGSAGVFPGDSSYTTGYGSDALGVSTPITLNAVNGIATFSGLRPRRAAQQTFNFLIFDATGFPSVRTPRFTVVAGAAARAFVDSDSSTAVRFANNQVLSSYLFLVDSTGNCAQSVPAQVTLGLQRPNGTAVPAGVSLSGPATQGTTGCFTRMPTRAITGLTASDSLRVTITAPGITIQAASNRTFAVDPFGAPTQLAFLQGPSATNRATNMTPPVTVAVTDNFGNVVTNLTTGAGGLTGTISLTLPNATTVGGATTVLGGGAAANLVNGIATFPALQVNNAGTGYQLRAAVTGGTTVPGITAAVLSALFNIL